MRNLRECWDGYRLLGTGVQDTYRRPNPRTPLDSPQGMRERGKIVGFGKIYGLLIKNLGGKEGYQMARFIDTTLETFTFKILSSASALR